jgi:3-phosphoshikimate 1-carboxyvinyltransferase
VTRAPTDTVSLAGGARLAGVVRVPGDKSISHRALLLSAVAEGTSTIAGLSDGDDVRRTLEAIGALGAEVRRQGATVTVEGGRSRLHRPGGPIDLGNSGTGMRLLLGLLAGLPFAATLVGDDSLSRRPMDRVADPLQAMGASVRGHGRQCLPPITVDGGRLHGIEYTPPMASAQVKSAVLLAGLDADGDTVVHEPVATRAHTEEMLATMGADIQVEDTAAGRTIRLRRSRLSPGSVIVPGDPSQAAFWVVAATVVPGSQVTVADVHLGAARTGFVGVLQRMGAEVTVEWASPELGSITGRWGPLTATVVEAEEIPSLDEVPILAVAAATAVGETRFRQVGELRVKESDRLTGTAALVVALGGQARVDGDDLVVVGGQLRREGPGRFDASGDHRMAMSAAVAALATPEGQAPFTITGWETVASSYPGFLDDLEALKVPA